MNRFTLRKNLLNKRPRTPHNNMENKFDFSSAPLSPPNFDGTFLEESSEDETKQDKNELLEMDANNNSPKVVASNLQVPTIRLLPSTPSTPSSPFPSTPKRKILPPVTTPVSEQLARRRVERNFANTIDKLPEKIENKLMKKVYDNRLVDENIGLKGELNASRIRCEELVEKDNQVQIDLSQSREKITGLEEANARLKEDITKLSEDGWKKVNELLKVNEEIETQKEDQKAEIARLRNILEESGARSDATLGLQTLEEGGSRNDDTTLDLQTSPLQSEMLEDGGARSLGLQTQPERLRKKSIGRPKKGRKSVNFTVPSKGAQSSKAMRRSQSNYAKINKTVSKEASSEPLSKLKMLENENKKLRMEIEELRKQLNKDEVKCPKANPAPNLKDVTVQQTKSSILRTEVNLTRAASIKRPKAANK